PVFFSRIQALARVVPDDSQEDQAGQDVERVHACHHVEHASHRTYGWVAKGGSQSMLSRQTPFHENHSEEEGESQHKGDERVVNEGLDIAIGHGGLTAVHEEGRDQEHGGHSKTEVLVQLFGTGQAEQVGAHHKQTGEDKTVRKQEQPQADAIRPGLEFVGMFVGAVVVVQLVDVHVIVHDQRGFDDGNHDEKRDGVERHRDKEFDYGQYSQIDEDHHALTKGGGFVL